jgi:hypothetical protein|tara:strand:+ start:171 stop:434 length:264 start_codon:yes stop_codon:yes gene_type:complete
MFTDLQWHDWVGSLGVLIIVAAYLWLQIGRIAGQNVVFSGANLLGSMLILVSLYFNFNFSAVLIEIFWIIISLFGLVMGLRRLKLTH